MQSLYPLRFREILKGYGFGGRWIPEAFPKKDLPEGVIAETWEVCSRPGESSEIVNGQLSGNTLAELIDKQGDELLGRDTLERFGLRFPLLIKFLDVSRRLREQVHPDDEEALRLGLDDPGKTEAWYMLRTREGATVACGNREGLTVEELRSAIRTGTAPSCMREYEVRPGDSFLLYAGTMHYSEGGVLLYEIMQNSGAHVSLRKPSESFSDEERESRLRTAIETVHIEDGADFRTQPVELREGANHRSFVLACTHFALERLDLTEPYPLVCDGRRFYVLSQIDGVAQVRSDHRVETLHPGNSCLLPACLGEVRLAPEGGCSLLLAYVPDLLDDIVRPLREAGIADERIVRLGARTARNPLRDLL